MRELLEITLLDYMLGQQDRIGNIDYSWHWFWLQDGKLELLSEGGPAIGMGDFHLLGGRAERFEEGQLHLHPGDKLFVYTDGIVEYQHPQGEFYGTERFCETLQALQGKSITDIIQQSLKSLFDFGDHTKPQDDITLLGLELKENSVES